MIHVIGIGPGSREWLPPILYEIVERCDVLFGGRRALELFPDFMGSREVLAGNLVQSIRKIRSALAEEKQVGVLVSGDPGFYSFLPMLRREFPKEEIKVYPGISSMQFAFARAGLPWQDAEFQSVHGRSLDRLPLTILRPLAVLTGGENTPQKVAQYYVKHGIHLKVSIGNLLSYPEEVWKTTDIETLAQDQADYPHAILLLDSDEDEESKKNKEIEKDRLALTDLRSRMGVTDRKVPVDPENQEDLGEQEGFGIPDELFIRGNVPLTKQEIRVQVLAKAKIQENHKVLDVGAGTGSLSIEAARLARRGMVFAVEEDHEAQKLILQNRVKFGTGNLKLIRGTAPQAFAGIPEVDVCFIGGSNGRLKEIMEKMPLKPGGKVVLTAVTLETASRGLNFLQHLGYEDVEVISIQAVRWKGIKDFHMAQALNPVFIISAKKVI